MYHGTNNSFLTNKDTNLSRGEIEILRSPFFKSDQRYRNYCKICIPLTFKILKICATDNANVQYLHSLKCIIGVRKLMYFEVSYWRSMSSVRIFLECPF